MSLLYQQVLAEKIEILTGTFNPVSPNAYFIGMQLLFLTQDKRMENDFYLATPYYISLTGTANAETPEHLSKRLDRGPPKVSMSWSM